MEFLKTNVQFVRWQEIIKNGFILQQGTRAPNESAVKSAVNSARLQHPFLSDQLIYLVTPSPHRILIKLYRLLYIIIIIIITT